MFDGPDCSWLTRVPGPTYAPGGQVRRGGSLRRGVDALDSVEVGSMALARLDGMPLAGVVLEPASPLDQIGAVLGVACPVLGLDESKAVLGQQAERLGVVVHEGQPSTRLGRAARA